MENMKNHWEKQEYKNVSLPANSTHTLFNQKSPRHPEVGVLNCHRNTNTQRDIATLKKKKKNGDKTQIL